MARDFDPTDINAPWRAPSSGVSKLNDLLGINNFNALRSRFRMSGDAIKVIVSTIAAESQKEVDKAKQELVDLINDSKPKRPRLDTNV